MDKKTSDKILKSLESANDSAASFKNLDISLIMYKAENGDARAQFHIGKAYVNEENLPRDYRRGLFWLLKSARQKNAYAMREIANLFMQRDFEVFDPHTALYWHEQTYLMKDTPGAEHIPYEALANLITVFKEEGADSSYAMFKMEE